MKKIATLAASAALLVAAVLPVAAANNCDNGTTGPFSTNNCTVTNTSQVTVNNVNDSVVKNYIDARANTGGNSASYNTLGGSIVTGNAALNTTVGTVTNVNTTNITGGPVAGSNSGSNNITGPMSDNYANILNAQKTAIDNQNTSYVKNDVDANANTGDNNADYNTGPGSIRTGNAGLLLNVNTHTNDSFTNVAAGAGGVGGNSAGNSTTGPFSFNGVDIVNTADILVRNFNDMVVKNDVDATANTGINSASYNTLGGNITTGSAGAGVGVNTEGNLNTSLVSVPMFGSSNDGGNGVTGPESDNAVNLNNNYNVVVDNQNNKCESHNADTLAHLLRRRLGGYFNSSSEEPECHPWNLGVTNDVDATSDTGNNDADYGTGPAGITAGMAELVQQVLTHMNDTFVRIGQ